MIIFIMMEIRGFINALDRLVQEIVLCFENRRITTLCTDRSGCLEPSASEQLFHMNRAGHSR